MKPTPPIDDRSHDNKLASLAKRLAERQLADGTASAQVLVHFLKEAAAKEKLEQKKLQLENELLAAKIANAGEAARASELYEDVYKALGNYTVPDD